MKTMRNALNITADNHELVIAGYIQLPVPITITEEWLNSPSLLYKEETNRERLMYDLRASGITEADFQKLIGKTIYSIPDDSIYNAYLEVTRTSMKIWCTRIYRNICLRVMPTWNR